ncbi:hypothetical protein VC83_02413 [Pseudogymnoascus destructans]|uniref:Uncharacterized protein n=1 Tax=Pseudogymnoascus destructans TaxID=655981 RepID=A0A177AFQ5_9PEZI|nr:uncharacterized protein VC83_02413 [Pseudogymnoascus destructans]OAF60938.1 hypothetical protein VC83_02413 [Pseudogymnoascus destructans]
MLVLGLGYGFEAAALRQRDPYVEALEGVELLLSGSPQKMQSGELLLGLSAWHLYPDLNVLDVATAIVRQQDRLVPAYGILTIGFKRGDDYDVRGLQWSLPLAHLRYYAIRSHAPDMSLLKDPDCLQMSFTRLRTWRLGHLRCYR